MSTARRPHRPVVVIVGGGAAGTLTALHLVRTASRRSTGLDITVIDPADRCARGVAFGTRDAAHLLNVPASGMSALPEDPGHFVAWRHRDDPDRPSVPYDFAPREQFGRYLEQTLDEALADRAGRRHPAPPAPARRAGATDGVGRAGHHRRRTHGPGRRPRRRHRSPGRGGRVGGRRPATLAVLRPGPLGARCPRRRTARPRRAARRPARRDGPDHGRRRPLALLARQPSGPDPARGQSARPLPAHPCRRAAARRHPGRVRLGAHPGGHPDPRGAARGRGPRHDRRLAAGRGRAAVPAR